MMVSKLLLRGMLCGMVAALLAFGFAKVVGEPQVDRAIAFESAHEAHTAQPSMAHGDSHADSLGAMATGAMANMSHDDVELVSRPVQASIGLFVGVAVLGVAVGGLFGLAFAFAYGRVGALAPRPLALVLSLAAFVVLVLVPALKYPPNPPSVGEAGTIVARTWLYFEMIGLSLVAALTGLSLKRLLEGRLGAANAALVAMLSFVGLVAVAMALLPGIDEMPAGFPAQTLWSFRVASLGMQAILWSAIGLLFGVLTERSLKSRSA